MVSSATLQPLTMLPRHAAVLLSFHAALFVLLHSASMSTAMPHETPDRHVPTSDRAENIMEGIHNTTGNPSRRRTGKAPGTATVQNTTGDPSRRTKPLVTVTAKTARIRDQSSVNVTVLGDEIETLNTDEQTFLPRFVTTEGREITDTLRPAVGDVVTDTPPSGTPPSLSPSGEKPAPRARRDPTPSNAAVKSGTASKHSLNKSMTSASSLFMSPSTSPSPLSSSPTTSAKKSSSDATTKAGQGMTKGTPKKAMLLPSDLTTKSPQISISKATVKTATLTSDLTTNSDQNSITKATVKTATLTSDLKTNSDQNSITKATPKTSMPIPSNLTRKADHQNSITKATPGAAMLKVADGVTSTTTTLYKSPSSTKSLSEVLPSHTNSPARSSVPQLLSHVKGSGTPVGLTAYIGVSGEAGETGGLRAERTAEDEPPRASRDAATTPLSAVAAPELRLMPDMLPQPLRVSQEVLSAAATKTKPKTKRAAATEKRGATSNNKKSTTGTATKNQTPAKSERQLQLKVSPGLSAPAPAPKKGVDGAAGDAGSNSSLQQCSSCDGQCPQCDQQDHPGSAGQEPQFRIQAAVSAVLTRHFGPDNNVIVPFDLELVDLADNYDNESGVFFCSVPGTYVIAVHLMSHPGSKVNARIFVNNRPVAALWADDSQNGGFYPSSSIQTISHVGFGDQVYVMLVDGGYGDSWVHANYNVFTIFLLYEDFMGR